PSPMRPTPVPVPQVPDVPTPDVYEEQPVRHTPSAGRPAIPPGRQQRSLADLRGIRSMGRRQENRRQTDEDDEATDIPPFMRRS
ncbi:MAG: hypothetical protein M3Z24_08730, partial [Chloroflexota bacterium]|nr:hypothetical protein [Chloroflexota bacterium]